MQLTKYQDHHFILLILFNLFFKFSVFFYNNFYCFFYTFTIHLNLVTLLSSPLLSLFLILLLLLSLLHIYFHFYTFTFTFIFSLHFYNSIRSGATHQISGCSFHTFNFSFSLTSTFALFLLLLLGRTCFVLTLEIKLDDKGTV